MVRFIEHKRGNKKPRRGAHPKNLVGQSFDLNITDIGPLGQGIATLHNGQKCFVNGAWVNEHVTAKITHEKHGLAFGSCTHVLSAHPSRQTPACEHHGADKNHCGGCPWLFVSYEEQIAAKQKKVQQAFKGANIPNGIAPILSCDQTLAYRTRAQLKTNGLQLGFVEAKTRTLIDIKNCAVLNSANQKAFAQIRAQLPNPQWKPRKKYSWTTIDIDDQHTEPSVNQRLPFMQGNSTQNKRMQQWLSDKIASLNPHQSVLELFCGSGNFTQVLAKHSFSQIYAIDVVEQATRALQLKGFSNVNILTHNLFGEQSLGQLPMDIKNTETLVLDPPREGYKALPQLLKHLPKLAHIFYISCDLATFKRDTEAAIDCGFQWQSLQPIDLFPQTPHVELMGHLTRKTASI